MLRCHARAALEKVNRGGYGSGTNQADPDSNDAMSVSGYVLDLFGSESLVDYSPKKPSVRRSEPSSLSKLASVVVGDPRGGRRKIQFDPPEWADRSRDVQEKKCKRQQWHTRQEKIDMACFSEISRILKLCSFFREWKRHVDTGRSRADPPCEKIEQAHRKTECDLFKHDFQAVPASNLGSKPKLPNSESRTADMLRSRLSKVRWQLEL